MPNKHELSFSLSSRVVYCIANRWASLYLNTMRTTQPAGPAYHSPPALFKWFTGKYNITKCNWNRKDSLQPLKNLLVYPTTYVGPVVFRNSVPVQAQVNKNIFGSASLEKKSLTQYLGSISVWLPAANKLNMFPTSIRSMSSFCLIPSPLLSIGKNKHSERR